jgi:hypothetical protein
MSYPLNTNESIASYAAVVGSPFLALLGAGIAIKSAHRPNLLSSVASTTLLQTSLYLLKTPRNEISKREITNVVLRSAGLGLITELATSGIRGIVRDQSLTSLPVLDAAAERALVTAINYLAQKMFQYEQPTLNNTLAAGFSGAMASASSSGLACLLPEGKTLGKFIISQAIKSGSSAAVANTAWNVSSNENGGKKQWHENLATSAVLGAGIGATAAAIHGSLPSESRNEIEKEQVEKEKLAKLMSELDAKREAHRIALAKVEAAEEIVRGLETSANEKKQAAIDAHNNYVATGNGKHIWEQLQKAAAEAVAAMDKAKAEILHPAIMAEMDAYFLPSFWSPVFHQMEVVNSQIDLVLNQESMLITAGNLIAEIPLIFEAVASLQEKMERFEAAVGTLEGAKLYQMPSIAYKGIAKNIEQLQQGLAKLLQKVESDESNGGTVESIRWMQRRLEKVNKRCQIFIRMT